MIQINGTAVELAEGTTLQDYLDQNQYNPARVAVERNGAIVPKAAYPSTVLADGDQVEIVHFVGNAIPQACRTSWTTRGWLSQGSAVWVPTSRLLWPASASGTCT